MRAHTLQGRLVSRILPLALIPTGLVAGIALITVGLLLRNVFEKQALRNLNGAALQLRYIELKLGQSAREIVLNPDLINALTTQNRPRLLSISTRLAKELNVDTAMIISADGQLLHDARRPGLTQYKGDMESLRDLVPNRKVHTGIERSYLGLGINATAAVINQDTVIGYLQLFRRLDFSLLQELKAQFNLESVLYDGTRLQVTTFNNSEIFSDQAIQQFAELTETTSSKKLGRYDLGDETYWMASLPLDKSKGALILGLPDSVYEGWVFWYILVLSGITILLFTVAVWLARRMAKNIAEPILALSEFTHEVASGDYGKTLQIDADDEIQDLTSALNSMSVQLQKTVAALTTERDSLEHSVRNRTKHLVEINENLQTTLNSIGEGVIVTDIDGRVLRMNPIAETMTGHTTEQGLGEFTTAIMNLRSSVGKKPVKDLVVECLHTGKMVSRAEPVILTSRTGKNYWVIESASPICPPNKDQMGVVLVLKDLTSHRALQEQLNHHNRLDALGQLAGGVAHDFNNMLGAILGAAEILAHNLQEKNSDDISYVGIMQQAAHRAADLTAKLLAFGRKGEPVALPVNVHELIDETIGVLQSSLNKRVKIRATKKADMFIVRGESSGIQNALLNLGINAGNAMPEGGSLEFRTDTVEYSPAQCRLSAFDLQPGTYIEIKIIDNGKGISDANLDRIFEPFFTTRTDEGGTGLGLAAVYGIVLSHRGAVSVESSIDIGTTFTLALPVIEYEVESEPASENRRLPEGTVLLVDDETLLLKTGREMLRHIGMKTITAKGGPEALEVINSPEPVSLVITDINMPGMSGIELLHEIHKQRPSLPVVLTSGFTFEKEFEDLPGFIGFIAKPFRISDLEKVLAKALNHR